MNRLLLLSLSFFFVSVPVFAQNDDTELLNQDKDFAHLSYTKGTTTAFGTYLDDNAAFLSISPLPIIGKENIMKIFAGSTSTVIWQPTGSFKDVSAKSGYTHGLSKWIYLTGDSISCSYYVYSTNWKKDETDKWKVTTDIGTEISLKNYSFIAKDKLKLSKNVTPKLEKTTKNKTNSVTYFSFESERKGSVPAILVLPSKNNLIGLVCFQHGIGEEYHKESFLKEAQLLAEKGIASIMIDAPFKRKDEGFVEVGGMKDAELIEQNTLEWLQVIKMLPSLKVNVTKFVFVGHSYGARIGALVSQLDTRFNKIIVQTGILNYAEWLQTTTTSDIIELRKNIDTKDFKSYINSVAAYDVSGILNKKNDTEFYFQAATQDETLSEYDILSCYEMLNSKKKMDWYASSHNLNEKAQTDRIAMIQKWISEK